MTSTTITVKDVQLHTQVLGVVEDPGYPGEYILRGCVTRIRRITPGFVTLDVEHAGPITHGTMTLSEAATVEVEAEPANARCADCGHPASSHPGRAIGDDAFLIVAGGCYQCPDSGTRWCGGFRPAKES